GGAANRQSKSSGRGRRHLKTNVDHGAAQRTHKALNKTKQHGFSKSDQAFHKIANGQAKEQHTAQAAPRQTAKQRVSPEKAIPLKGDENTGTDDFKEFNG
ncbi:MAG: hypothetical protein ACYS3N_18510, partial [Planctomycetota bacterium]